MRAALLAVALVACGPSPTKVEMPPPVEVPTGLCPAATTVRPTSWKPAPAPGDADDGYGGHTYGAPAIGHWQIPLAVEAIPWDAPLPDETFGPRTEEQVRALVTAPLGPDAWIFTTGADAPCRAKVTGYYLGRDNFGGPDYTVLAAQAEGCAPPDLPGGTWAALGSEEPRGCRLVGATSLGGREADWKEGDPVFPEDEVRPPSAIAAAIPPRECAAPACQMLWSASRATAPGLEVDEVTVTYVYPIGDDYCEWAEVADHALYLGAPSGKLRRVPLGAPDAEVPMKLSGILHDGKAARLLLTFSNGDYGVHPIAGTRLGPGRIEPWFIGHEEDAHVYSLWNVCGL